jgi:very-short-patch-repair endonuclease
MAHFSRALAERVSPRHGVVTRSELIIDGFSRREIDRLVERGTCIRIHNGVYRLSTSPDTFESRCAAACAADPEVVITGVAAARLWSFRHVWLVDQPVVLVAHDRTPLARGVVLRRTNALDATDWVERADGIRSASPPRTWFDCARDLTDEQFERVTEWVLDKHATVPTLWTTARRLQARGRPGSARVRRVMEARDDWQKPAGSGLELRVLQALERRGIVLHRQYPLVLADGAVIHPDGADPAIKWALEIDHVTWHGGRLDAQYDKTRDRRARLVGWQIERVTDQELAENFDVVIDQLVALHRQRSATFAAA